MEGFVAKAAYFSSPAYEGSGTKTLMEILPEREDFMTSKGVKKIEYLDFYNKQDEKIMVAFKGAIVSNSSLTLQGSAYVSDSVQVRVLEMKKANK